MALALGGAQSESGSQGKVKEWGEGGSGGRSEAGGLQREGLRRPSLGKHLLPTLVSANLHTGFLKLARGFAGPSGG